MLFVSGFLYWTDWENKTILLTKIGTDSNVTKVIGFEDRPMDIQVVHPFRQMTGLYQKYALMKQKLNDVNYD